MEQAKRTGYPSIDKPWLQFYSEEAKNAPLPACTIYAYLYRNNKEHADEIALNYFDKKATFAQLFERIALAAKVYKRIGVCKGDIVTLCTVTTPEVVYSLYALNLLGATVNMIDPRTHEDGIVQYLTETHTKVLLVISAALPKISKLLNATEVQTVITVSPAESMPLPVKLGYRMTKGRDESQPDTDKRYIAWNRFLQAAERDAGVSPAPYEKEAVAVIVHTGGTTGTPKGVMLSNDNINAIAHQYHYGLAPARRQRFLNIMPPFIAYGIVTGVHMPLCCGNVNIIIPSFDPTTFDKLVVKYRPNHFCGAPSHLHNLIQSKRMKHFDLSFLVSAGVGGDRMTAQNEEQINRLLAGHGSKYKVAKGYGMTESCSCSCSCLCKNEAVNKFGSVGVPLIGNVVSVFDPVTKQELGYHTQGEICLSGPTVILGYYDNPEETAHVLQSHSDGRRWIHSGDIGYMDEDGVVFVIDRMKRMIIRPDGFKVYPSVIERVIAEHDQVEACAVVGVPCAGFTQGMIPKAYVVLKKEAVGPPDATLAAIEDLCHNELAEYVWPREYVCIDQLPLTPIGKVDYRALERMGAEDAASARA